ncbi:MAG: hypothetical protein M3444_01190 [Acidobacteriota bacterium]|nr:hypothetical protein [Acidobacteriota bacterium]
MQATLKERAQMKMLPLANRANDVGPAATVCCNACRTCVTTNLVGAAFAAGGALVLAARRMLRR